MTDSEARASRGTPSTRHTVVVPASIDMVSGATDTSEGYLTSLQSALDRAGL